jgi:hypothetical protein
MDLTLMALVITDHRYINAVNSILLVVVVALVLTMEAGKTTTQTITISNQFYMKPITKIINRNLNKTHIEKNS